jgi:hypothetical protein
VGKTEEEVAPEMMRQIKQRAHPDTPPAMATDGKGGYRATLVQTWGQGPAYKGWGHPPEGKRPPEGWQYVQVVKERSGYRWVGVKTKVVYGDPKRTKKLLGAHPAWVERSNLTSRQMKGRLGRKTRSFSKERELLQAACAWEDGVYNLTRPLKTLRQKRRSGRRRW